MTIEDLERLTDQLGISLTREQLTQLLPDVQRLREHAARLRELPLDPVDPPLRFSAP